MNWFYVLKKKEKEKKSVVEEISSFSLVWMLAEAMAMIESYGVSRKSGHQPSIHFPICSIKIAYTRKALARAREKRNETVKLNLFLGLCFSVLPVTFNAVNKPNPN